MGNNCRPGFRGSGYVGTAYSSAPNWIHPEQGDVSPAFRFADVPTTGTSAGCRSSVSGKTHLAAPCPPAAQCQRTWRKLPGPCQGVISTLYRYAEAAVWFTPEVLATNVAGIWHMLQSLVHRNKPLPEQQLSALLQSGIQSEQEGVPSRFRSTNKQNYDI